MSYTAADAAIVTKILETNNFYEILDVPSSASIDDIKTAHKKLALQVHPDKNNFPKAKEAFIVVRKATAVLLDKDTRQKYDAYLRSPRGYMTEQFELSDDAIDTILLTAGIASVVGIAAGLWALYDWYKSPKKQENEPKYAK